MEAVRAEKEYEEALKREKEMADQAQVRDREFVGGYGYLDGRK